MANVDIPLQLAVPITIMIDQKACIILKRANVHTTIRDYIIRHPLDIRTIPGKDMDTGTSKDMDRDMAMDMHKSIAIRMVLQVLRPLVPPQQSLLHLQQRSLSSRLPQQLKRSASEDGNLRLHRSLSK